MAFGLSEAEIETLLDLRESPGWLLFWNKVVPAALLESHLQKTLESVRLGDARESTYALGRHDGVIDVLESLYRAVGEKTPLSVTKLRKTGSP